MSRWIKHWQALPIRNRVCGTLSLLVMIASLIGLALYISALARA